MQATVEAPVKPVKTTVKKERKAIKSKEVTEKPKAKTGLPAAQVRILKVLSKAKASDGTNKALSLKEITSKALVSSSFGWIDKSVFESQEGKTKAPSLVELKMIKHAIPDQENGPPVFVITEKGIKAISSQDK